jgi:hypothetical protein
MSADFFCVMASAARIAAGECLHVIPEKRAKKSCHFCSPACHREYRRLRREGLAKRKCRLCGRPMRKPKSQGLAETSAAKLDCVRSAQSATEQRR